MQRRYNPLEFLHENRELGHESENKVRESLGIRLLDDAKQDAE